MKGLRLPVVVAGLLLLSTDPALATCICPVTSSAMMAERVYNMERVIEQCHGGYTSGWPPRQLPCDEEDIFPAAVNAALSATTTNPAGARVLYFPAGVYEIRTPVYITQPGVTIRGEAGPYVFSPSADTSKATVFRCGISSTSAACLTLGPWTGSASGLVVEGVAWTWDTSVTAQEGVAGLRLRNLTASTVRRSYWENFPEDAVRIEDSAGCLFDELTFQWSGQGGANMISASDATDLHFRRITQNSGYIHGFHFEAVDDVEVESAVMHHTLGANVFLHNTGRVILRGIRFEVAGYPEEESRDYGVIHLTSDSAATPERTLDLVVSECYFDAGCRGVDPTDDPIYPIVVDYFDAVASGAPVPRVLLRGNTYLNVTDGIIHNNPSPAPGISWQCVSEQVTVRLNNAGDRTTTDLREMTFSANSPFALTSIAEESCQRYEGTAYPTPPTCVPEDT